MPDFLRALILYLCGKIQAAVDPEYATKVAAYEHAKKLWGAEAAARLQAIADNEKQIAIGESQLAADADNVKGNEDAIKTLELKRAETADAASAADAAIDARGPGDIDRPLPGTNAAGNIGSDAEPRAK